MDECAKSLCPVGVVCEELDLGYEVQQGNTGASFTKGGKPVLVLGSGARVWGQRAHNSNLRG